MTNLKLISIEIKNDKEQLHIFYVMPKINYLIFIVDLHIWLRTFCKTLTVNGVYRYYLFH